MNLWRFVKGIILRGEAADNADNIEGSLFHNSTDHRFRSYLEGAVRELTTNDQTQTLTNKSIDGGSNNLSNIANSSTTAVSTNTPNAIVARDSSGNFAAGNITAHLVGNADTATFATTSGSSTNFSGSLSGDVTGTQNSTVVSLVGGSTAANVHAAELSANAATALNTANAIVKRDSSGNFSAGTITASLNGNASTATSTTNFSGNLSGDVSGTQSTTSVNKINGTSLAGLATGILKNTTATGVPSIAIAADFPTLNQNTTGTASNVTGIVALLNGGTGTAATSTNAAFNALSPMTTGGDLIYGGSSGAATRLANGTAGQVLTSAGTTAAPNWTSLSTTPNYAVTIQSSTYSILTTDNVVLCDGNFTVTLPTAVGVTGKQYIIKKTDSSLANIITVATTGGQAIDGHVNVKLYTLGESYTLTSDGSNWQILEHKTDTSWSGSSTIVVGATTTAPTFPTSGVTTNSVIWRRIGANAEIRYMYLTGSSISGGNQGSGDYIISLPSGLTADTTNLTTSTSAGNPLSVAALGQTLVPCYAGLFLFNNGTTDGIGAYPSLYSSTQFRVATYYQQSSFPFIGSTIIGIDGVNQYWSFTLSVPISGWSL